MRLRSIYLICVKNLDKIEKLEGKSITTNNRSGVRVSGWEAIKNSMEELISIEFLKEDSLNLFNSVPFIYRSKNTFDVESGEWSSISNNKKTIITKMKSTISLYESLGVESNDEVGIDIKLPMYSDFTEFKEYIDDLELIITKCPLLKNDKEEIKFANVDIGSTWLTFLITGATVLGTGSIIVNNIAALVDKAIAIKSHLKSLEEQKAAQIAVLEANEQKSEVMNIIIDSFKKMERTFIDGHIKELEQTTQIEMRDGEEKGRTELTIKKLGDLIDKGMAIYSAIDAPKEVKLLFPPLEIKNIDNKDIKFLENNE